MQNYFEPKLGKKIIYKIPIFLMKFEFKKIKGGGCDKDMNPNINANWLLLDGIKMQYTNAIKMRDDLDNKALRVLEIDKDDVVFLPTLFHMNQNKQERDDMLINLYNKIKKTLDANKKIIYKSHTLKDSEAEYFLTNWYANKTHKHVHKLLHYADEIHALKLIGIKTCKSYIPRFNRRFNPLYQTYHLLSISSIKCP